MHLENRNCIQLLPCYGNTKTFYAYGSSFELSGGSLKLLWLLWAFGGSFVLMVAFILWWLLWAFGGSFGLFVTPLSFCRLICTFGGSFGLLVAPLGFIGGS
jgi:hypothetical protein